MTRSSFSALLGAAFGAVAIHPIRERCLDAGLANPELSAVGFTAGVAALIWLLLMACREPAPVSSPSASVHTEHQVHVVVPRPTPPTSGSGVKSARQRVAEAEVTGDYSQVSCTDLQRYGRPCQFKFLSEATFQR